MKNRQLTTIASLKEHFIPSLQKHFGADLESVMLYGSAAGTGFNPTLSDINLLSIIKKPSPEAIITLGQEEGKYLQKNRISLQIQTSEEYLSSSDVFPMEYLDMIDRRQILFGKDFTEEIAVETSHLRHQVEERLRGAINALRQGLLNSRGKEKGLRNLLISWFGAQAALLRGLLRLKKEEHIPFGVDAIASVVAEVYGVKGEAFVKLSALRDGGKESPKALETATEVLLALTELSRIVDTLEV